MQLKTTVATLVAAAGILVSTAPARADFIDLWADKSDMPAHKAPKLGHSRVLLIPVEIDYTGARGAYLPVDMAALTSFFTAPADPQAFSFNGFISRASGFRYRADVTVAPLVKYDGCPAMLASSGDCTIARGDLSGLTSGMDFVRDVFRRAHDEGKVDFRKFDINGYGGAPDGVIDGAMIVVNVPGVGIAFPISFVNGGSNLSGGNGGPLVIDGVQIPYVAIGGARMIAGVQHLETVILHEFGHILGLADLYYEHPANDLYPAYGGLHYSTMGDYSYDLSATMPDAESRRALSWTDMHVVSGTETLTLNPVAAGGGVVKLGMMTGNRREYFLAEVRGPWGAYDQGIADVNGKPAWGLAVYHVDWSRGPLPQAGAFTARLLNCLDCDPWHPFISNLESQNRFGLIYQGARSGSGFGSPQGGISDDQVLWQDGARLGSMINPGLLSAQNRYTATNWYDGSQSGIVIDAIKVNADHSVTATFTAPVVADACADVTCALLEACVPSGPTAGTCVAVAQDTDGGLSLRPPPLADPASGCSTSSGSSALASLFPLFVVGVLVRRKKRRPISFG